MVDYDFWPTSCVAVERAALDRDAVIAALDAEGVALWQHGAGTRSVLLEPPGGNSSPQHLVRRDSARAAAQSHPSATTGNPLERFDQFRISEDTAAPFTDVVACLDQDVDVAVT